MKKKNNNPFETSSKIIFKKDQAEDMIMDLSSLCYDLCDHQLTNCKNDEKRKRKLIKVMGKFLDIEKRGVKIKN